MSKEEDVNTNITPFPTSRAEGSSSLSAGHLSPGQSPNQHRRRGSSVGHINLGDTSSPSFATMPTSNLGRRQLDARILKLSETGSSDMALVNKMIVAFRELTYRHTWVYQFIFLLVCIGLYVISGEDTEIHHQLKRWIIPAYHIEGTDQYGKGGDDFRFVFFYAVFFFFLREFLMCIVLRPLAYSLGITKESKVKRFMEQTYSMFYYGISGPFGLWIMRRLPLWFFETTPFYTNYPHKTHDIYFKVYYLGQAAFWVQQAVVLILQLEKPRKDFKELVLHHIITIALIWNSYRFHFTWMGLAVYITMDVSDFFLATSKTLNYLDSSLTPPFFIVFIFVWIYLRHWVNLRILWSVLTEFKTVGDYTLNWDTQQYKCYISQPIVFFLIAALQLVNAYWLFLIFRILYRMVVGGVTKDERSDSESEEEQGNEKKKKKKNQ